MYNLEVKPSKVVSGATGKKPKKTEAEYQAMIAAERRRLVFYNDVKPACTNTLMASKLTFVFSHLSGRPRQIWDKKNQRWIKK